MTILVLNGANLNMLGARETDIYGTTDYNTLVKNLDAHAKKLGVTLEQFQSNHEGALIDKIQQTKAQAIIINAGGFTHTSVSLRDAIAARNLPTIEVHISNIYARECFRQKSLLSGVSTAVICGFGLKGYFLAVDHLTQLLKGE